jgi:hypothetical protein
MRRSISQRIVSFFLPVMLVYMALYAVWSIIRPWMGY